MENTTCIAIDFHAIDNCIELKRPGEEDEQRCDVILVHSDQIIFLELKDVQKKWITGGIDQLEKCFS